MYAITGITGKVGGALARALLADRRPVRAVIRDIEKGRFWASQGCEIARAEMQDPASLTAAFTGTDGVFILFPSEFDPGPGFPEARAVIAAVKAALESARPNKVVCLSTIGAQSTKSNLLTQRTLMEQALGELPMPITFLRPAWRPGKNGGYPNFASDVSCVPWLPRRQRRAPFLVQNMVSTWRRRQAPRSSPGPRPSIAILSAPGFSRSPDSATNLFALWKETCFLVRDVSPARTNQCLLYGFREGTFFRFSRDLQRPAGINDGILFRNPPRIYGYFRGRGSSHYI